MPTHLYLDTARLGRMCKRAYAADRDFTRFAMVHGCTADFDDFLANGAEVWPQTLRKKYPGLCDWHGLEHFHSQLKTLLGISELCEISLANRSAQLMRLAARLLFVRCTNVLVTDLDWPRYSRILAIEQKRARRRVTTVKIRDAILRDGVDQRYAVEQISSAYRANDCDGLFLTSVSNEGVRLPIQQITDAIASTRRPRFTVVDGAQAFCHIPAAASECDLFITGAHKWLEAYHPMGIAASCRPSSRGLIRTICREMTDAGELDDPLLNFTRQLTSPSIDAFDETVCLAPLFSAVGAATDAFARANEQNQEFHSRLESLDAVSESAAQMGWLPLQLHPDYRTAILLLEARSERVRNAKPRLLRSEFQKHGVTLTAYEHGLIRAAIPRQFDGGRANGMIRDAFRACG